MNLKKIDPALELMGEFAKLTNGLPALIDQMRKKAIFSDGEVPQKHKILTAMVWAISARCEPCIKYYVHRAMEKGVTEREFGEFLAIAATMGGCVGEMWAVKAFQAYKELASGKKVSDEDPSCCHV